MRLIDADALLQRAVPHGWSTPKWVSDIAIDDAPTINAVPAMRWICSKDTVPDTDDHVLCVTRTKAGRQNIVIGYYMDGMWRCGMNSNVTHWMPLPEVPIGGEMNG